MSALAVVHRAEELRDRLARARGAGQRIGFVPTMGALHAGHRSLVARAVAETDLVVVSVFVNPLQFDDPTDLEAYPRTLAADTAVVAGAGGHLVFAPSVEELYPGFPTPPAITVHVAGLTDRYEGAARPGHFDGVATVVTKLLALVGPCRAYFGRKDAQQLAVVRRLVAELLLPAEIVACPTVREPDGLALSSRNGRLVGDQRRAATALYRAIRAASDLLAAQPATRAEVQAAMAEVLGREPAIDVDYVDVVDPETFVPVDPPAGDVDVIVAARLGAVRLLDALPVTVPPPLQRSAPVADAAPATPLSPHR